MVGYPDNSFGPQRNITRAETVTILDRIFAEVYNEPGVWLLRLRRRSRAAWSTATGVTLQNLTIKGDLLIARSRCDAKSRSRMLWSEADSGQRWWRGQRRRNRFNPPHGRGRQGGRNPASPGTTVIDLVNLKAGARVEEDGPRAMA